LWLGRGWGIGARFGCGDGGGLVGGVGWKMWVGPASVVGWGQMG